MNFWPKRRRRTSANQLQQEFKKFLQEQAKLNELHKAMREVELYESYVQMIRSVHQEADEPVDWEAIQAQVPTYTPDDIGPRERLAQDEVTDYQPSFWERLLGRTKKKRIYLEERVMAAREEDLIDYRNSQERVALANRILAGDETAYIEAVERMKPFDDLSQLGSEFSCYPTERPGLIAVEFLVHSQKVIPTNVKTLTKTGKLSISQMPVTRYHGLEQDYVCSTLFRIARDMFALLPLEEILIHVTDYRMNEAVGKMELVTIVSVHIERRVLNTLNMMAIDPSEAVKNFTHRMNFLKTKGFQPIKRLTSESTKLA